MSNLTRTIIKCALMTALAVTPLAAQAQSSSTSSSSSSSSSASATPTPTACESLAACVNAAVPTAVASCAGQHTSCTDKTTKFAASAGEIAERAIAIRGCSKFKTVSACNNCYRRAKNVLRFKYDQRIFKGLLAQAVEQIEDKRQVTCPALKKQ